MSQIKVTSDQLRQQSGNTTSVATQVEDLLTKLKSQIADLSSGWEGAASSSFQSLYTEWQRGAEAVHQSLEGIATLLNKAADAYDQAEQSIKTATQH